MEIAYVLYALHSVEESEQQDNEKGLEKEMCRLSLLCVFGRYQCKQGSNGEEKKSVQNRSGVIDSSVKNLIFWEDFRHIKEKVAHFSH